MSEQLTHRELAELRYVARHTGYFWGGPEMRGKPPMHETEIEVSRYVRLGFLKHVPGKGYVATERARRLNKCDDAKS